MEKPTQEEIFCWITQVFKDRSLQMTDLEFPDYDTSGGALGDIIFVNVIGRKEKNEESLHLLIKKGKTDRKVLDDMNLRVAYINEINLYSKISPFFRKFAEERSSLPFGNLPKFLGTVCQEDLYVIVMENLKPKGYRMHELEKPHNLACAKLVLEAYAKWQALCLAVRDQKPDIFRNLVEGNSDFLQKKMMQLFGASVNKELSFVMGIYKEKGENKMVEKLEDFKKDFQNHFLKSISIENCNFPVIRHGDCWNNNFLFAYDEVTSEPKEVIIIDWQNSTLGPPLADVAQYLLFSCSATEYVQIDDLLKFYHNTLSTKLRELGSDPEKCFSWKDCVEDFKKCAPPAILTKPIFVRASLATSFNTSFDISQSSGEGDFHGLLSDELKDADEYFRRIDDTFKIFMRKGLI